MVAPWPRLRAAATCAPNAGRGLGPPARASSAALLWTGEFAAPRAALAALARDNCVIAAALRFVRVPAWTHPGGEIELWDVRFGRGGFALVVTPERPRTCPAHVPPWTPPRADVLAP
jgi:inner membrane protein